MIGINIMALAVALSKVSQLGTSPIASIPNVLSIAKHFHLPFAKVKLWSDLSMVFTALILSFLLSRPFLGIREGTLLATVFTAPCVSMITYSLDKLK